MMPMLKEGKKHKKTTVINDVVINDVVINDDVINDVVINGSAVTTTRKDDIPLDLLPTLERFRYTDGSDH